MSEFGSDELFLTGRLQISTARDALSATGINHDAETQLTTFLNVHSQVSMGEEQDDLVVYLRGDEAESTKADVVMGLELLKHGDDIGSGAAEAARGLLELLRQK